MKRSSMAKAVEGTIVWRWENYTKVEYVVAMHNYAANQNGSGYTLLGDPAVMLNIESILTSYGFAPVITVDPQDLTAMKKAVDDAVAALNNGEHPAIVTRRPCLLLKRVKHDLGMCKVNADKCRSCKSCLKVGCPAVSLENGKAVIDSTQCVGCTVCAQACPFDAIEKEEK